MPHLTVPGLFMLPPPAVTRRSHQRRIHFNPTSPRSQLLDSLRKQSRLTNLGVVLLIGACSISILLNVRYWLSTPQLSPLYPLKLRTVDRPTERKHLNHLIIVPCHSIWTGTTSWSEEKDWMLEPYQKGLGRVKAFYQHISTGWVLSSLCSSRRVNSFFLPRARLAKDDPESLLIFSG